MKKIFILTVFAVALLLAPQNKGWAGDNCNNTESGDWSTVALWDCGHVPVAGDQVILNPPYTVTANVDISVSLLQLKLVMPPDGTYATLNAGSHNITLSETTDPLRVSAGIFNADTSTVKLTDAAHDFYQNLTLYNLQWATPLTAPRTLTFYAGATITKAAGGTFNLNGSSATNKVSFAGTGTITPALTVYYCGGTTVTGIDCQPGGPPPAPTVTNVSASTANGSYKALDTVDVTVIFSEAVNVTGTPQLTLATGGAGTVVNYLGGTGTNTLTFTSYTVGAGDTSADLDYISTAALALNGGTIKNLAGTYDAILTLPAPGAANSLGANKAIVIDTTAPTLTQVTAVPATTNDATPDYTFSSSEAGTITYTGDCSSATTAAVLSNTLTFNTLSAGAHSNCKIKVTDSAGNASADLTVSSFTVDTVVPTVTINQAAAQADPATAPPINFTVVFSESVTGFDAADVTLSGIAGATGTVTGSGTTYNVAVSGMTAAGTLTATIAAGVAADSAGNGNAASTSGDNSVIYSPPPASVVSINRAGTNPTNAVSVTFTVTFSEVMSGIDIGDFALALTGTASGTIASALPASGQIITVTVNTVTGDGTLGLNLIDDDSITNSMSVKLGGTGTTGAGNGSFTGQTYTPDHTAPTVALSSTATDPTGSSPFSVTATFSESVTGFVIGDIAVTNGSAGNFSGSGTTYTFDVTPAADGLVTVNVAANAAQDSVGYNSTAATALTRTYDHTLTAPAYGSSPAPGSTIPVGTAAVGSPVSTALQVSETGNAALNVTSHALGGTNPGDFSVTPATLSIADGGAAQNLTIHCIPGAVGSRTATLTVNHNAGAAAAYTLECTGTATPPPVTAGITLDSLGSITGSSVVAYGTATGAGIGERGFYWWIPPTTATHFGGSESGLLPEGYGAGSFSLTLTGLKPGNAYKLKAYVKVGGQIITSDEQTFTTATTGATGKMAPTVLTDTANYSVSGSSITVSGEITDIGASQVNVYGFVYAPHTAPFTGDNMPATGDRAYAMWDQTPLYQGMKFTGTIKNIPPGKWYLRAYAHNVNPDSSMSQPESLSYGEEISFTIACTPETCIPGDVNGDGKVSLDDAMLVLRIIAGLPVGNVNLNADVNGDGRIGLEELGYILQKVAELRPSGA